MKRILIAAAMVVAGSAAFAQDGLIKLKAQGDVPTVMDALEAAVKDAGATVFARVDHAGGAETVGMELAPEQLLIFGNPKLGTPAMQDDPLAGLYLPLRVLVYSDADGMTWIAYEDPAAMLDGLEGIPDGAEYEAKMQGALKMLTTKAAVN
ncbi:DUF302 domain-containing protein [Rhodalgimonas zhirmunskyi]|uniref:DUF302 domain-containing protein n=1 Tax=Rhodalgimonas zhirmunskyi TaxID=2964767 RepID=A0AAJ1UFR3_9RHOB|nr:DUF302 domain-containing protein [Rhodoalgimonas zhirmunskyi]MDQ2095292.1 DUF302 domain-containing protein [Rhodoalgimonas zhirmunskyi]